MDFIRLEDTRSTSSYLASIARDCPHATVVTARSQTAGRGQRGNSWEAAPGMNITMSLLLRPEGIAPSRQFVISQAVSMGIVNVLRRYLPGHKVSVKWPNDIYVGDGKICGILIENVITSKSILHSIAGVGINVNQREFFSDAPNPVSMMQITGYEFDVDCLTGEFASEILSEVDAACSAVVNDDSAAVSELSDRYFNALWRSDAYYPYMDNLRGERIEARIVSVAADGIITLSIRSIGSPVEELRSYAFKEITALL